MSSSRGEGETSEGLAGTAVAVYGLGKMGLPLASVLADHGAAVRGVDVDATVVQSVNDGNSPVQREPGLVDLVSTHAGDRLVATTDGTDAANSADVMIVIVPTLVDEDRRPDLTAVEAAANDISDGVDEGDLVILESTVPPGTTAGAFLEAVSPPDLEAGSDFHVAHCPERTSSGTVIRDLTESYPKIVGGIDEASTAAAAEFYRVFNRPGVIEMGSATAAEAVKVFEGVYRDVNIALANELATVCEQWRLDAWEVFEAANSQPYCDIHDPGVGVGGHCIPVYPYFVTGRAEETQLVRTARQVNEGMPERVAARLASVLDEQGVALSDARVLVLGLTYRPGVDETRFSPSFDLVDALGRRGATVFGHDPLLSPRRIEAAGARPASNPAEPTDLDAIVLATAHEEYRRLDLAGLRSGMRTPVLLDGRNFFGDVEGFVRVTVGVRRGDQV